MANLNCILIYPPPPPILLIFILKIQCPISKRILRQSVDAALCKVNGARSTICRQILFETEPMSLKYRAFALFGFNSTICRNINI